MTTAHRPTFDPAQGKEALRGPAYHQRLQPAHTALKSRQAGQGTAAETSGRDLRAQLLEAEAKHLRKINGAKEGRTGGGVDDDDDDDSVDEKPPKRLLELSADDVKPDPDGDAEESIEAKRRRVLEETREIDADDDDEEEDSSDEESDEEDEAAELARELAKIRQERAEQREKEERERAAKEQEQREKDIAFGNPLLNPKRDYGIKRRWDDDVVFKNQARGTEEKRKPEFVNDLLRSDFHKRFMSKYVR